MYVNIRISVPTASVAQLESTVRPSNLDATAGIQLIENLLKDILSGKSKAVVKLGVGTSDVTPNATGGTGVVTYTLA